MRKLLVGLFGAAILLTSVAHATAPVRAAGSSYGGFGWLDGTVRRGPIVPVCVAGDPCDGPAIGVTVLITRNGVLVARAVTDRTGTFHKRLKAGLYTVSTALQPGPGRGSEPRTVRVLAGRRASVRLFIDTGIR